MRGTFDRYRAAMRDPWRGWWLAWPPTQLIRVGAVFDTSDGVQRTAGNLAERAVPFDCVPGNPQAGFTYDSHGTVSVDFKLAGRTPTGFSALTEADAGALVKFGSESSVLVVYNSLQQEGFSDTRSVAAHLTRLFWNGRWPRELVAVSDVIMAEAGLVITAEQRAASAELRAAASAGAGPASLLDLAGRVTFARTSQIGMQWVGPRVTPFYRVVGLRKDWLARIRKDFGPPQPGRGAAPVSVPSLLIDEARDDPDSVLERWPLTAQPPAAEEQQRPGSPA